MLSAHSEVEHAMELLASGDRVGRHRPPAVGTRVRDGFAQLLRAEWTKVRTVHRTIINNSLPRSTNHAEDLTSYARETRPLPDKPPPVISHF
jgi:hypothetical protein